MLLELTKIQEKILKALAEQIIDRNTQHNLTGYKDIKKLYKEQIIDCVKAFFACKTGLEKTVVDCGSGAGLPGLVWGVMDSSLNIVTIDSSFKKINFQTKTINTLQLANIKPTHIRIEDHKEQKKHTIVTKAFGSVKKTIEASKNNKNKKNLMLIKKDNEKTHQELLDAASLIYDYKRHTYSHNKERMVVLEIYDS
tara:strand:+ start:44 stop:631 length:588 start_codon:yes stop_codon:yes gene_type:complete